MNVEHIMTRRAHTCRASDTLDAAAKIMWEGDIGAVIVVDAAQRPLAVITDRDLSMAAYTQGRPLWALRVQDAMSRLVYTCHPHDRVSSVERTMRLHRVRRLPVVTDHGQLVGVVTLGDVARARLDQSGEVQGALADAAVTLREICRPHGEAARR